MSLLRFQMGLQSSLCLGQLELTTLKASTHLRLRLWECWVRAHRWIDHP
jgi:hypothetical protein